MSGLLDQLHKTIMALIEKSLDDDYTDEEQDRFIKSAETIREKVMVLRKKEFKKQTPYYSESITKVKEVIDSLQKDFNDVKKLTGFFDDLATLVEYLDKLITHLMPLV